MDNFDTSFAAIFQSNVARASSSHPGGHTPHFLPEDLARLFVTSMFVAKSTSSLDEARWLIKQELGAQLEPQSDALYREFLAGVFRRELLAIAGLKELFGAASAPELKSIRKRANELTAWAAVRAQDLSNKDLRGFADSSVALMTEFIASENSWKLESAESEGFRALRNPLYRAFDAMDAAMGIDYEHDFKMSRIMESSERLYEGAGVGVQSSYTTLLQLFDDVDFKKGARLIDLGSGYGRLGIIAGLARPDIEFIGYEYVSHRVKVAQDSAERIGIDRNVKFVEQDLSQTSFVIPEADVYYMFDPFTEATYRHVLNRMIEVGRDRKTLIVTKGGASVWLDRMVGSGGWKRLKNFDEDTLALFQSPAA